MRMSATARRLMTSLAGVCLADFPLQVQLKRCDLKKSWTPSQSETLCCCIGCCR